MARSRKHVDVMEVLRLRLAGRSLREIASELRLGRGTVHRSIQATKTTPCCPKTQNL
jgi:DNA-binding IclR family transcriptional regulator